LWRIVFKEDGMNHPQHGGARSGAGRKPQPTQRVKRAITLSVTADAIVVANQHPGEPYSQTVERLLGQIHEPPSRHAAAHSPMLAAILAQLTPEYQVVAVLYRALGWSRQQFEHLIQTERMTLGHLGVRLHVATKASASGRRERYITVDGMRYSALSWERSSTTMV
jgi:hypothetical protein